MYYAEHPARTHVPSAMLLVPQVGVRNAALCIATRYARQKVCEDNLLSVPSNMD
jgi:hypothetical protein